MEIVKFTKDHIIPNVAQTGFAYATATIVGVSPQNAALFVVANKVCFHAYGLLAKGIKTYVPTSYQTMLQYPLAVVTPFVPMSFFSALGTPWQTVMAYQAINFVSCVPLNLTYGIREFCRSEKGTTDSIKNFVNAALRIGIVALFTLCIVSKRSDALGLSSMKLLSLMTVATSIHQLVGASLQTLYPIKNPSSTYDQFATCLSHTAFISASTLMGHTPLETATYGGVSIVILLWERIVESLFSGFTGIRFSV